MASDSREPISTAPRRVVSLNLCTDQLLLLLAPRARIAAVSWLAPDATLSVMARAARGLATVRANAEEVLSHDPDLVLSAPFAARGTLELLRRLGRRVVMIDAGQSPDTMRHAMRQAAGVLGSRARIKAERLVRTFDAAIARLSERHPANARQAPSTLVYNVAGLVSGPGSLTDAALRLAGFRNAATDYRSDARGIIALEQIVARPPDLIVVGHETSLYRTVQSDNLRHPVLRRLARTTPSLILPQKLTICATPHLAQAVALLAASRANLEAKGR